MSRYIKFFIVINMVFLGNTGFGASCENGFDKMENVAESSFLMPIGGLCQVGGYSLLEIPEDIVPVYNGFTMGAAPTLCEDGYMQNGTTCVEYATGTCKENDDALGVNNASFMALDGGLCKIGGYSVLEIPNDIYPVYNGFTMGAQVTLCNNGYLANGSSCTSYTTGDCPTNYQDLSINVNTITKLSNGVCNTGYSKYTINQQCNNNTTDSICAILCSGGLEYTDVGTCASICPGEHTTLRTSTGLVLPMWSEKQITPSLNVQIGENVCYVNLVSGQKSDAINIKYDNKIYHAVK